MFNLYLSFQSRALNMDDLFMNENQFYPPSISNHDEIHNKIRLSAMPWKSMYTNSNMS